MPAKKTTKATPKEQAAPAAEDAKAQAVDADDQAAPAAEDAKAQAVDADDQAAPAAEDAKAQGDAEHDLVIAEVVERFRDKETGSVLKAGTTIAVPPSRFDELEAAGVATRLEV